MPEILRILGLTGSTLRRLFSFGLDSRPTTRALADHLSIGNTISQINQHAYLLPNHFVGLGIASSLMCHDRILALWPPNDPPSSFFASSLHSASKYFTMTCGPPPCRNYWHCKVQLEDEDGFVILNWSIMASSLNPYQD